MCLNFVFWSFGFQWTVSVGAKQALLALSSAPEQPALPPQEQDTAGERSFADSWGVWCANGSFNWLVVFMSEPKHTTKIQLFKNVVLCFLENVRKNALQSMSQRCEANVLKSGPFVIIPKASERQRLYSWPYHRAGVPFLFGGKHVLHLRMLDETVDVFRLARQQAMGRL